MKCFVLVVLSFAIASEANPSPSLLPIIGSVGKKIGDGIGSGFGLGVGTAVNVGVKGAEKLGTKVVGAGLGALDFGSGLAVGLGTGVSKGIGTGLSLTGGKGRNSVRGKGYDRKNPGSRGPGRRDYPERRPYPNGPSNNQKRRPGYRGPGGRYEDDKIKRRPY